MIAALASGLLGQIEGIGSIADGVSAIGSLFKPGAATPAAAATPSTGQTGHRHGHGHIGHALSDQLQTVLLQQQSSV